MHRPVVVNQTFEKKKTEKKTQSRASIKTRVSTSITFKVTRKIIYIYIYSERNECHSWKTPAFRQLETFYWKLKPKAFISFKTCKISITSFTVSREKALINENHSFIDMDSISEDPGFSNSLSFVLFIAGLFWFCFVFLFFFVVV